MIQIEFSFNQIITEVQANLNDKFENVINKYAQKTLINPETVCFLANGKVMKPEYTVESQLNQMNKEDKKLKVIVNSINEEEKEQVIIKAKDIICPECFEPCLINLENFHINLHGCVNDHTINNIKVMDFSNTQKINISNIICEQCNMKNKGNTYKNEFYRCLTCSKNLCLLCKQNHELNHNIFNYDQKNYICHKHNDSFIKYCQECKSNICILCEKEHLNHKTMFFGDFIPSEEELQEKASSIKTIIDTFNDNLKDIIKKLNDLDRIIKLYYQINIDIINNYNMRNKNYNMFENIKEIFFNNEILDKLDSINKIKNTSDKVYNLIELYKIINLDDIEIVENKIKKEELKNINNKKIKKENDLINQDNQLMNRLNQMTIIYNIGKNDKKIRLFDNRYFNSFVKNNKDNCYLIIDGKKTELCNEIYLNENQKKETLLKIKFVEINSITNLSYMFYCCTSLKTLSDIFNFDTKNITNMYCMFYGCSSLESLPDFLNWNTQNVNDMSYMFYECYSLKSPSDISNWNTQNVTNMYCMFYKCTSLELLPDINNWNTANVRNMSYIFGECTSLQILPDISIWNTENVRDMSYMFYNCTSLISLPDISKWDTIEVNNMKYMFYCCTSLKSLPDISEWDTTRATSFSHMFYNCYSLKSLPDISKWDTQHVTTMSHMFYNCNKLKSFPNISKWDVKKVEKMSYMFYECTSLRSFPDIYYWDVNENLKKDSMFSGVNEKLIPEKFKGTECPIY